jgi:hypothetical protein
MSGEDVYDVGHVTWCSLCKTTEHDECEPTDHSWDLRYECMACGQMIPYDKEIQLDGWAWVHPACAERWHSMNRYPSVTPDD